MSKLPPSTQATRRALATFDAASIAETETFVASLKTTGKALNGGSVAPVAPSVAKQLWAAGRNGSAFAWNRAQMTFTRGNAIVPRAAAKAAANAVVGEVRAKIADAALRLQQGTLDVAAWAAEHDRYVKILNGANSALARGGFDEMTPRAWESASQKVAKQFGYSRAFAEDVASGRYGKPGKDLSQGVLSRALQYGDSGRATYENTLTEVHVENGFGFAKRIKGDVDNCPDCIEWARDVWTPIDEIEEIGSSVCRGNCHCVIIFSRTGDSE